MDVLWSFLKLGCLSFGGPVAHLGYFEAEFVRKRQWLTDMEYADLVALCQFLPGPASSQVGFSIGYKRGGLSAAFLAWVGFTLPSAVLMILFAAGLSAWGEVGQRDGWLLGLKLAAVAVVANAIANMGRKLCPDRERLILAIVAAVFLVLVENPLWQMGVILVGAIFGWLYWRPSMKQESANAPSSQTTSGKGWVYLLLFGGLLCGLPLGIHVWDAPFWLEVGGRFYRAGALVFGGGHVVLPLLNSFTVSEGWIAQETFLAGYSTAQALPGPLFAFSAFLGGSIDGLSGVFGGGLLALVAIYLPSWLLVLGVIPYWELLRTQKGAQAALMGTNAVVVGLLMAAFYDPIWIVSVQSQEAFAMALGAFGVLRYGACTPWVLVIGCAALGVAVF